MMEDLQNLADLDSHLKTDDHGIFSAQLPNSIEKGAPLIGAPAGRAMFSRGEQCPSGLLKVVRTTSPSFTDTGESIAVGASTAKSSGTPKVKPRHPCAFSPNTAKLRDCNGPFNSCVAPQTSDIATSNFIVFPHLLPPVASLPDSIENACRNRGGEQVITELVSRRLNPLSEERRSWTDPFTPRRVSNAQGDTDTHLPDTNQSMTSRTKGSLSLEYQVPQNGGPDPLGEPSSPGVEAHDKRSVSSSHGDNEDRAPARIDTSAANLMDPEDMTTARKLRASTSRVVKIQNNKRTSWQDSKASGTGSVVLLHRDKLLIDEVEVVDENSKIIHPSEVLPSSAFSFPRVGQRDLLNALDDRMNLMDMHWLHTGPKRAEAGFQDPSLGWVTVRAETGPGGVHASIIPASQHATQVLDSHISELKAHLVGPDAAIRQLTLLRTHDAQLGAEVGGFLNQRDSGTNQDHGERQSGSDQQNLNEAHYGNSSQTRTLHKPEDHDMLRLPPNDPDLSRLRISLVA